MTKAFDDALDPGTRIGPVVLGEAIGQGSFGIVYRAVHDRERDVAVKEFFPKQFASRGSSGTLRASQRSWDEAWASGLAQFTEEARALKRLRHSNIVQIHELIEQNGSAYAVMELVEGETLDRMLSGGRKLAPDQVMSIAKGLIEALRHMNQRGILHRDIAPANVIMTPEGEPMLIDFGGARHQVAQLTMTLPQIARQGYSAFESFKTGASVEAIGPWTDIYATAALLYRLVTGETPKDSNSRMDEHAYSNRDPQPLLSDRKDLLKDYPKAWLAAVDKGLALRPQDRPQSAEAWAEMFRHDRKRMALPAMPKWLAPAGAGLAALVIVTIAVVLISGNMDRQADFDTWTAAETGATREGYERYLIDRPQGAYVAEARSRIAAIDAAADVPFEPTPDDPIARKAAVAELQAALKALRLYDGSFDGIVGKGTSSAAIAFARTWKLNPIDLATAPLEDLAVFTELAKAKAETTTARASLPPSPRPDPCIRARADWPGVANSSDLNVLRGYLNATPYDCSLQRTQASSRIGEVEEAQRREFDRVAAAREAEQQRQATLNRSWSAIAVSDWGRYFGSGYVDWGGVTGRSSAAAAEAAAIKACDAKGDGDNCEVIGRPFNSGCGAFAYVPADWGKGRWGEGWAANEAEASRQALADCDVDQCTVRLVICATPG